MFLEDCTLESAVNWSGKEKNLLQEAGRNKSGV